MVSMSISAIRAPISSTFVAGICGTGTPPVSMWREVVGGGFGMKGLRDGAGLEGVDTNAVSFGTARFFSSGTEARSSAALIYLSFRLRA